MGQAGYAIGIDLFAITDLHERDGQQRRPARQHSASCGCARGRRERGRCGRVCREVASQWLVRRE